MRLAAVDHCSSPLGGGRTRLVGRVEFATTGIADEELWFDVEERFARELTQSGNSWLAALLPLAVTLQEPLGLDAPVDPWLLEGAGDLMHVWEGWYPELRAVPIEVNLLPIDRITTAGRTGAFFSGGVDSFHTLLRHQPGGAATRRFVIDDVITVWGLDIPIRHAAAFQRVADAVATIAAKVGVSSVTLATNLRESRWTAVNWGLLGQGPALASLALVLERRFGRVLIPSSISFSSTRHWGTHPLTDTLLSTSRLEIRNDGAQSSRFDKARSVAASPLAMAHLRSCWFGQDERNCGRCEKCLRTLTYFELLHVRERARTFPPGAWTLEALGDLRYRNDLDRRYQARLAEYAATNGRRDIAKAIRHAARRYDLRRLLVGIARRVGLR